MLSACRFLRKCSCYPALMPNSSSPKRECGSNSVVQLQLGQALLIILQKFQAANTAPIDDGGQAHQPKTERSTDIPCHLSSCARRIPSRVSPTTTFNFLGGIWGSSFRFVGMFLFRGFVFRCWDVVCPHEHTGNTYNTTLTAG